jgi:hypothetical protein
MRVFWLWCYVDCRWLPEFWRNIMPPSSALCEPQISTYIVTFKSIQSVSNATNCMQLYFCIFKSVPDLDHQQLLEHTVIYYELNHTENRLTSTHLVVPKWRLVFVLQGSLHKVCDGLDSPLAHPYVWVLTHLKEVISKRSPQHLHTRQVHQPSLK